MHHNVDARGGRGRAALAAALTTLVVIASAVTWTGSPADATTVTTVEAESMALPSGTGATFTDPNASVGEGLLLWSNTTATVRPSVDGGASELAVSARADLCGGGARMVVSANGKTVGAVTVDRTTWTTYRFPVSVGSWPTVKVAFTNDRRTKQCDRNLRLDVLRFAGATSTSTTSTTTTSTTTSTTTTSTSTTTTAPPAPVNPLAARPLHTASWTAAGDAADRIRATNPQDAARLDLLDATPTARWFGEWSGDIRSAVHGYVSEAAAAGRMPVLVAYNIPLRDCGSYSGGGATSAAAYRDWIRSFAAGIGSRPAAVVLEPDAIALIECLTTADRAVRNQLLDEAIDVLAANPGTAVYLDAGHAHWLSADEAATRLRAAGVADARGVSLNVSNFGTTTANVAYADALHARLGVHAVIDTSRNGEGSDGTWCNPFGRAIGERSTTTTASRAVDAYLWVKVPGESDGTCNGGPAAGTFWVEYAVDLVRNAEVLAG